TAKEGHPGWLSRILGAGFDAMLSGYRRSLGWALARPALILVVLLATLGLNFYLFSIVPKGFFPQQDQGRLVGGIRSDQSISFQLKRKKMNQFVAILMKAPAVASVVGFTGGGQTNSGFVFLELKPLAERKISADEVIGRLRKELRNVTGARLFLQSVQDIRSGGRQSNSQHQFTLTRAALSLLHALTL